MSDVIAAVAALVVVGGIVAESSLRGAGDPWKVCSDLVGWVLICGLAYVLGVVIGSGARALVGLMKIGEGGDDRKKAVAEIHRLLSEGKIVSVSVADEAYEIGTVGQRSISIVTEDVDQALQKARGLLHSVAVMDVVMRQEDGLFYTWVVLAEEGTRVTGGTRGGRREETR